MILLFRMTYVFLTSLFRRRVAPLDTCIFPTRVYPNDLDVYFHMNNGRYLSIMDLGRLDFVARTGILRVMMRRRWYPLVGSAVIRYERSLNPGVRYQLQTRVATWDEKWLYIEQRFMVDGEMMASGAVKGVFKHGRRTVAPKDVMTAVGVTGDPPPMPQWVQDWLSAEAALAP